MGHYMTLLVFWATLMNLSLELQMTEQEMKEMKGRFCGNHLSDMLSLVCNGVYNNKQKKNLYKNENRDDYQDFEQFDSYSDEPIFTFPFRSKQRAKSIIPIEFRKRNYGVANECCHKSCSLWEMSGYCAYQ